MNKTGLRSRYGRYANGMAIDPLEMLLWIETFIARNRRSPSVREIAGGFRPKIKLSTNTVQYHLDHLEEMKKIKRTGEPRGIEIIQQEVA